MRRKSARETWGDDRRGFVSTGASVRVPTARKWIAPSDKNIQSHGRFAFTELADPVLAEQALPQRLRAFSLRAGRDRVVAALSGPRIEY